MVRARMLEVLEAAPDRVAAPCPVYGRCGGCHYQHAPYEYQLAAKRAILVEALRAAGKDRAAGGDRGGGGGAVRLSQSRAIARGREARWAIARRGRTNCAR